MSEPSCFSVDGGRTVDGAAAERRGSSENTTPRPLARVLSWSVIVVQGKEAGCGLSLVSKA